MTEELLAQLGVADARQRAVVIPRGAVRLQPEGQLAHVQRETLDHVTAHLVIPDVLGRVEVAEEDLGELVGAVGLETAHHRRRQHERQVRACGERCAVPPRRLARLLVAVQLRHVRDAEEVDDGQHVGARVHEGKEERARQVEPRQRRIVLDQPREEQCRALDNRRFHGEQELHEVRQPVRGGEQLHWRGHRMDERAGRRARGVHRGEREEEVEDENAELRAREDGRPFR